MLPKAIYRLNAIAFKTSVAFFTKIEPKNHEIDLQLQKALRSNHTPEKKEQKQRLSHFLTSNNTTNDTTEIVIKTACYWNKNIHTDQ